MVHTIPIKDLFIIIKHKVAHLAVESIESLFDISVELKEPWKVTNKIQGEFEYIFTVESENSKYEGLLCIGASQRAMEVFFDPEIDWDEAKDALGETANILVALLMDESILTDVTGILLQHPPTHHVGDILPPQWWGVEGHVYLDDEWLYFGYALGEKAFI